MCLPAERHSGGRRTPVRRKIQFARRSSGMAKTTRVPMAEKAIITTLATSSRRLTRPHSFPAGAPVNRPSAGLSRKTEKANPIPR